MSFLKIFRPRSDCPIENSMSALLAALNVSLACELSIPGDVGVASAVGAAIAELVMGAKAAARGNITILFFMKFLQNPQKPTTSILDFPFGVSTRGSAIIDLLRNWAENTIVNKIN